MSRQALRAYLMEITVIEQAFCDIVRTNQLIYMKTSGVVLF